MPFRIPALPVSNLFHRVPNFFHRDWRNDFKNHNFQADVVRGAQLLLPFAALYSPCALPISMAASAMRVYHNNSLPDRVLAVAATAAYFFNPSLGYAITTVQDSIGNIARICQDVKKRQWKAIALEVAALANNILYLATLVTCRPEVQLVSLSAQILMSGIASTLSFREGYKLESAANALMGAIQFKAALPFAQQVLRNITTAWKVRRVLVGMLRKKWQYPSDHLPVGADVNGTKIVSWNVLNGEPEVMKWVIEHDTQALKGSMLSALNQPVGNSKVTQRELEVIRRVGDMTSRHHAVALQECSYDFLNNLQKTLSADWQLVRCTDKPMLDQNAVVFDAKALTYKPEGSEVTFSAFPLSNKTKPLQNLLFEKNDGTPLRLINTHIPGDPKSPGRHEMAQYLYQNLKDGQPTALVGDHNFEKNQIADAFYRAGLSDFTLWAPWRTNIDPVTHQTPGGPSKTSKAIDFVITWNTPSQPLSAEHIDPSGSLQSHIDLLAQPLAIPIKA